MTPLRPQDVIRRMPWGKSQGASPDPLIEREWLVTNGLGGYASGTVVGAMTRRYHGLLIAALPAPLGRVVMLNHLSEHLRLPGREAPVHLIGLELAGGRLHIRGAEHLVEFRLEAGLPVWRYQIDDHVIEKRVLMPHRQNTVHVNYRLLKGRGPVRLRLRPSVHFRRHEDPVSAPMVEHYRFHSIENRYELSIGPVLPVLKLMVHGARSRFTLDGGYVRGLLYRIEASRGYDSTGILWTPGHFSMRLAPGKDATLVASTESWETIQALSPAAAFAAELERRQQCLSAAGVSATDMRWAELVLAADQFLITPSGRVEDAARAHAAGEEARSVIAGYHWFTDWGRDTMISLEGLTLCTGRVREAAYVLRTFASHLRDGLIPNLFPEGEKEGLYHTADATLWFFHALDRYVSVTGDRDTLRLLLPRLREVVDHHLRGTRFGIGVDPADGLLRQGAEGYQLTWMDAKVGDWVVTPRRGKAVEINALWYNALRLLEQWTRDDAGAQVAQPFMELAERACESFNRRFWYAAEGRLYDVVDGPAGDDAACRPNQVFALSLRHPVLERPRWESVLSVVQRQLLTPVGLRSLAPGHPDYKAKYFGDLRARDSAYHQGTTWSWLIGPFVDAWLRVYPERRAEAHQFLGGLIEHLDDACIGSVSEVFDAEEPYVARGCIAQAWGVAELLRTWVATRPN